MNQQQAFIDHLNKQPDDTTARLVYADWLDEHDMPEEAWRMRQWPGAVADMMQLADQFVAEENWYTNQPDQVTLQQMIEAGSNSLYNGYGVCISGEGFKAEGAFDDPVLLKRFWTNWEILTGRRCGENISNPFSAVADDNCAGCYDGDYVDYE